MRSSRSYFADYVKPFNQLETAWQDGQTPGCAWTGRCKMHRCKDRGPCYLGQSDGVTSGCWPTSANLLNSQRESSELDLRFPFFPNIGYALPHQKHVYA
jgi:hypothetical protein